MNHKLLFQSALTDHLDMTVSTTEAISPCNEHTGYLRGYTDAFFKKKYLEVNKRYSVYA